MVRLNRAGPVDRIPKTEKIEYQRTEKMTKGPKVQKTIKPKEINSTV